MNQATMPPSHFALIALIALILAGSAVVQGSVGFGFALFAAPLLVLAGLPLPRVIAVCGTATAIQVSMAAFHFRAFVPWRAILPVMFVTVLTVPVGVWLLHRVVQLDKDTVRAILGCVILAVLAVIALLRIAPREKVHAAWGLLAGGCCGVLAGMIGSGGPPVVVWAMAHRWDNRQSRVALWLIFLAGVPTQLFWLYFTFHDEALHGMKIGLLGMPVVLAGMATGIWIGNRLSKERLRRAAYALLLLTALSLFVPWGRIRTDPAGKADPTRSRAPAVPPRRDPVPRAGG